MELIKDEMKVERVNEKVQVSRTIIEQFENSEYLRRVQQIEQQDQNITAQKKSSEDLLKKYCTLKEESTKLYEAEQTKMKEERAKVIAENEAANK